MNIAEDSTENTIRWSEADGIVTLTLDEPGRPVNTINPQYLASMDTTLRRLARLGSALTGIVVTSAKSSFFAGADLKLIQAVGPRDTQRMTSFTTAAKTQFRRLETLGVPVVAAIGGSALGGGLELALACHYRILLDDPAVRVGLPEVSLGLLPGGGGVVRTVRLLGLDRALDEVLLPGRTFGPSDALRLGLVDELASDQSDLVARAQKWVKSNRTACQPWDAGQPIHGSGAFSPEIAGELAARTAALRARHRGAPMAAEGNILAAAVESSQVDIETAFAVETRYFVELATGSLSKNRIQAFYDRHTIRSGASRPDEAPSHAKVAAVLGAGMMGAGIALSAAARGIQVRLKDIDLTAAEHGREHAKRVLDEDVRLGKRSRAEADAVLDRIEPVAAMADLADADLVIEAVFEDPDLKAAVLREVQAEIASEALIASNTSTLPISDLARAIDRPENFIGMHFFSPVHRMDLVEIVVGEKTSSAAVARAFDIVLQLGKTPIVVNDGRGFFTSRVILTRLLEATAMLGEGVPAPSIERASFRAGYPTGTLALLDEVSLTLAHTIYGQFRDDAQRRNVDFIEHPGGAVLEKLVTVGRRGRAAGAGCYDYVGGRRAGLWSGLAEWSQADVARPDLQELTDRLLFAEAVDAARCIDSGVVRSSADANVGSLLGIGYPSWTGGVAQFAAGHPGGIDGFITRAAALVDAYGPRFTLPSSLLKQRAAGDYAEAVL